MAKGLLRDLAIDVDRFDTAYDQDFYERNGLEPASTSTPPRTEPIEWCAPTRSTFRLPCAAHCETPIEEAVAQMPLAKRCKDLLKAFTLDADQLPDHGIFAEPGYLQGISYHDFAKRHRAWGTKPWASTSPSRTYFGVGIDGVPALEGMATGFRGWAERASATEGIGRKNLDWMVQPYIYHFPDGNASIPRLLVRRLVPDVAPGSSMEDVVPARFDYARLDDAGAPVRIRLNSTVVRVEHDGDPKSAEHVDVTYVRNGRAERVRGRRCILACWHRIIPHLCPELPADQRAALGKLVKVPLVYTNVLLSDWHAVKRQKLGIGHVAREAGTTSWRARLPGQPGQLQVLRGTRRADRAAHERVPPASRVCPAHAAARGRTRSSSGAPRSRPSSARSALTWRACSAPAGFDPARRHRGITVNRWPHGYAYQSNSLFDPEYGRGESSPARSRGGASGASPSPTPTRAATPTWTAPSTRRGERWASWRRRLGAYISSLRRTSPKRSG